MLNLVMSAAENPLTPMLVLVGAGLIVLVEAWKVSHKALMGDLYTEFPDE